MDPSSREKAVATYRNNKDSGPSFLQQSDQESGVQEIKWTVPQIHNAQPVASCPQPVFSNLVNPGRSYVFQMDLLSPSKDFDVTMECSPNYKRPIQNNHTGLTPGFSELQPSRAKRSRKLSDSSLDGERINNIDDVAIDSPIRPRKLPKSKTETSISDKKSNDSDSPFVVPKVPKSLFLSKSAHIPQMCSPIVQKSLEISSDLRPCKLFSDSPRLSPAEVEAMMDDIDVPQIESDGSEDFLKRQKKGRLRRWNSLDLRKQFTDMSNTPTSSFKQIFQKSSSKNLNEIKESLEEQHKKEPCFRTEAEDLGNDCDHERIKSAVDALQCSTLIADGSRAYCLPVIPGKHSDLKSIHHDTLASLLKCPLPDIDKLTLIDCRYPYEYIGGHIKGAINIYTEEAIKKFLDEEIKDPASTSGKHILIFYCEFSSQRGPGLLRHIRSCDRQQNADEYPKLTFPEAYCAFGGYKEFYHQHPEFCDPSSYTPMIDEKYASDLRHFRSKAKSWAAGERLKILKNL